jgi:hypothetical protein
VAVITACTSALAAGPPLPEEIVFEGARLERASAWSRSGVSGAVFVNAGEKLPDARMQLGIITSVEHPSGTRLSAWVMDQYHRASHASWYESSTADEACKVGLANGARPRPYIALHVCRTRGTGAACAEIDERVDDRIAPRCLAKGADCWDELCTQQWARRPALEALLQSLADGSRP